MFDTFKQVITDSMQAHGYGHYATTYGNVVDAAAADLATHVSKCAEDAIEAAVEKYEVDADDVRAILVEAGLAVEREPDVEVNVEVNDTNEVDVRLTKIEETLARLSALAERAERSGYLR